MRFWKMNGAGNDFLIINNMIEKIPSEELPRLVRVLCERHLSIGADGMMIVDAPSGNADFCMRYYNSDGSEGEMCGNGARCICRYGYENGLSGPTQRVETRAGTVTGERIDERRYRVRLNDPGVLELDYPVTIDGKEYACSYVELGTPGVPHAVVPLEHLQEWNHEDLFQLGRKIRYSERFPKGANVNFFEILPDGVIRERTYERGVEDFTYACGTGTASVVVCLTKQGKVSGKNVRVQMPGGELMIDYDGKDIFLTGPTNIVAKGEVTDEEL